MTAQNLTMESIYGSNESFDFSYEKKYFRVKDTDIISRGILLALYGDESVTSGKVSYAFTKEEDKYTIVRDFNANIVTFTKNEETPVTSKQEVEESIKNLIGLDKVSYEKLMVINAEDAFNTFNSNPSDYLDKALAVFNISDKEIENKQSEYLKQLENVAVSETYLESINSVDSSCDEKIATAEETVLSLKKDLDKINKKIFKAEEVKESESVIDALSQKLTELQKAKLDKVSSDDGTETKIAELTLRSNNLKAELENDNKTLENLENDFKFSEERVNEINNVFNNYVAEGINVNDAASDFNQKLTAYYADVDKKVSVLQAQKDAIILDYNQLLTDITATALSLQEIKYSYTKKKSIREGMVFETSLSEKEKFLKQLDSTFNEYQSRLETLNVVVEKNLQVITDAKKNELNTLGKDITIEELSAELNDEETLKQTLYRNQIVITSAQKDISAIDNKIYENEEAQRSYIEDRAALDNAKLTLSGYVNKLDEKLESLSEKLIVVSSQKKYYDNIDAIEFGDKCPICNGQILDKNNFSKESDKINKAYSQVMEERQKALSVKKDYALQLDKVNIRLGELTSRVNTSETYLKSLHETKEAKIAMTKKLFESCRVKNLSELDDYLGKIIKKLAETTKQLAELSNFVNLEKLASFALQSAKTEIKNIEEILLPQALSMRIAVESDIAKIKNNITSLSSEIGKTPALEQANEITSRENNEDELSAKLAELTSLKVELYDKINDLNSEILILKCRDNSVVVNKDGVYSTYPQLVVSLIKDRYDEYFNMLKKADEDKKLAQEKLVAISNVINGKNDEIASLSKELTNISSKDDTLNEDETFIKCQIKVVQESIEQSKIFIDEYQENISVKNSLLKIMQENQKNIEIESNCKALNNFVVDSIGKLNSKQSVIKEKLAKINALKDKDKEFLINNASRVMSNLSKGKFGIKKADDKLEFIDNNDNGKVVESDGEKLLLAGLSCERAVIELIKEVINYDACQILSFKANLLTNDNLNSLLQTAKEWNTILLLSK